MCLTLFAFQDDKETSDFAIGRLRAGTTDASVAKVVRDDLHDVYLKHAPAWPQQPAAQP